MQICGLTKSTQGVLCCWQGGDVSPNSMHMLHSHGELPNSVEIIQGLSMGGFDEAKAAIRDGRMPAQDFK